MTDIIKTAIAFIGCGYVADFYLATLKNWSHELSLKGVYDRDERRLAQFSTHYSLHAYQSIEELLNDPNIDIVINLTNPAEHFTISEAALRAGKHVYTEKPLALTLDSAKRLIALSKEQNLHIVSAPSSVFGDAAQSLISALRVKYFGRPYLVYAELDDGMVHKLGYNNWKTETGRVWPAQDEFKTGCTIEHTAYALSWLVALFGSVTQVTSDAALLINNKGPDTPDIYETPDFSTAILRFENGVVARLTNSIIANHNHKLQIFCDQGHFEVSEVWDFSSPVLATPHQSTRLKRQLAKRFGIKFTKNLNKNPRKFNHAERAHALDFTVGIVQMARALKHKKAPVLSGDFALHITEVTLAIQYPHIYKTPYRPESRVSENLTISLIE